MILLDETEAALRGRNHAEGYPGGLIETMNRGVRARSCAAQPPSDRKTPCLENPRPKGGILTNGDPFSPVQAEPRQVVRRCSFVSDLIRSVK